ncbi:MAG: glycosyltransferase family 2 protein [Methylotenera sp.]
MLDAKTEVGVVVIGRNEGQRLVRCLQSLCGKSFAIVYVDSGSTDESLKEAVKKGVNAIALDMQIPFTAARARNAGFQHLLQISPNLKYVQFVDGDCEVMSEWMDQGVNFLEKHDDVAVVSGHCRERYPEKSIYNLMCDLEWNTPIGEAKASGGNALMRVKAFQDAGGFRNQLIAGEEPELCVRLRMTGWKVWRLDAEMVLHDAAMTRFNQWWKRNARGGYAFAEGAYLHGASPERHWVKESRRSLIWGLVIPVAIILTGFFCWPCSFVVALIYPLQIIRLALRNKKESKPHPWLLASFSALGKFAEIYGQLRFHYQRAFGRAIRLIEYK